MNLPRIFTLILALAITAQAESPFTRMWRVISGGAPPATNQSGVKDCTIEDRDPATPPRVDRDDWNKPCILDAPVTAAQLRNVKDPARFLNARKDRVNRPTPAVWIHNGAVTGMRPVYLTDRERAEQLHQRLIALGCKTLLEEWEPSNPVSAVEWRGETRRYFLTGSLSIGLVNDQYASNPVEVAEAMLARDIQRGACHEALE